MRRVGSAGSLGLSHLHPFQRISPRAQATSHLLPTHNSHKNKAYKNSSSNSSSNKDRPGNGSSSSLGASGSGGGSGSGLNKRAPSLNSLRQFATSSSGNDNDTHLQHTNGHSSTAGAPTSQDNSSVEPSPHGTDSDEAHAQVPGLAAGGGGGGGVGREQSNRQSFDSNAGTNDR